MTLHAHVWALHWTGHVHHNLFSHVTCSGRSRIILPSPSCLCMDCAGRKTQLLLIPHTCQAVWPDYVNAGHLSLRNGSYTENLLSAVWAECPSPWTITRTLLKTHSTQSEQDEAKVGEYSDAWRLNSRGGWCIEVVRGMVDVISLVFVITCYTCLHLPSPASV